MSDLKAFSKNINATVFEDLFWSIQQNRMITINYKKFGSSTQKYELHPHYLKEYQQRWYLLAWNNTLNEWRTFGLERIIKVEQDMEDSFYPNQTLNQIVIGKIV